MPSPTNTSEPTAGSLASTLTDLMAYHDLQFILCAYKTVLGRDPDPEGLAHYVGRLRAGIPKIQILADLRLSREGRARKLRVGGLDKAIRRYRMGQLPVVGYLLRVIGGTEGNAPIERRLRSLENQILAIADDSHRRLAQIEQKLTDLRNLTEPVAQIVVAAIHATNQPVPPGAAPAAPTPQGTLNVATAIRQSQDVLRPSPQKPSIHTMIEEQVKPWTK